MLSETSHRSSPKPILTIDFSGLCAFVKDRPSRQETRRIDVVMPKAAALIPELCPHRVHLSFYQKDFDSASREANHFSFSGPGGENMGFWRLDGRQLEIEDAPLNPPSLTAEASFDQVLDLDELTRGLSAIESHWVDPGAWTDEIACRMRLSAGMISTPTVIGDPWLIGPENGRARLRTVRFAQVVRYELFADDPPPVVVLRAHTPGREGDERLAFKPGARLALSHLCAFDEDDGDRDIEKDVLAFYEMSTLEVTPQNRSVFHSPNSQLVRPQVDTCPPVTGHEGG